MKKFEVRKSTNIMLFRIMEYTGFYMHNHNKWIIQLPSIALFTLLCLCYSAYADVPSRAQIESEFKAAVDSHDVDVLNAFIDQYRYTGWEVQAIYYRDKAAVDIAKKNGSIGALESFLERYPDSAWKNHAIHFRDKKAYRQAKMLNTLEAYNEFLVKYPNSQWTEKVLKKRDRLMNVTENATLVSGKKTATTNVLKEPVQPRQSSQTQTMSLKEQRTQKALEVYEELNERRQQEKKEKLEAKLKQQKKRRQCNRMNDQLKKYSVGRRWYDLDENGERRYLTDEEIQKKRKALQSRYKQHCE